MGEHGIPFSLIFTKCDKLGPNALNDQIERDCKILLEEWESLPEIFRSSAEKGTGKEEILDYIDSVLKKL